MKPTEVTKPTGAAAPPKDSIVPNDAQKAFLEPLIAKYVEKVRVLIRAQQELQEVADTIYNFSTGIVASGRKGQWFALQADLVVCKGNPMANQLMKSVWPQEDKE